MLIKTNFSSELKNQSQHNEYQLLFMCCLLNTQCSVTCKTPIGFTIEKRAKELFNLLLFTNIKNLSID